MNCFRFSNVIKITTKINIFNGDNSNITKMKTQHRQIMTTITIRTLKYKPMSKIPTLSNPTFFTIIGFNKVNSFT